MSRVGRDLGLLFVLSLIARTLAILPVQQPGYMDAAYSYDIALSLARGQGLVEPFLWNYLDDPAGLPHPSHLYWMPLPTLLAWVGIKLFGESYGAAQVPFVFLSALLPLVSYWIALRVTGERRHGWLAGLLTVFSGFYVLYWGHTDNFTPFALAGSLCLGVAGWGLGPRDWGPGAGGCPTTPRTGSRVLWKWLGAGALAGLAHLSRADAPLLFIAIGLVWVQSLLSNLQSRKGKEIGDWRFGIILWLVLGYFLVMLPWFVRNWALTGAALPAAGTKTIWLTTYDDLFSYGRELSLQTYLAWGWGDILRSKLDALGLNLQTVVAVFCLVFLAPLAVVGWWRLRRHPLYRLAAWYGLLLFLAMTLVFTFPGPRGGLFHSGGALLPFVFCAAVVGLDVAVEWVAARRRGWDTRQAKRVFSVGMVGLALLISGFLFYQGVIAGTRWRGEAPYRHLVEWLAAQSELQAVVMVGDPPGYWYHGGGPSIVVPNEPVETLLAVADRYGARYLVLDSNRPGPLASLYEGIETHPRLRLIGLPANDLRLYRIEPSL